MEGKIDSIWLYPDFGYYDRFILSVGFVAGCLFQQDKDYRKFPDGYSGMPERDKLKNIRPLYPVPRDSASGEIIIL